MFLKCEKGQHLTTSEQNAIDYINENVDIIGEMSISDIAKVVFFGIGSVMIIISVFIISNTIKLAVYSNKREIFIMNLFHLKQKIFS